jgi:hypothetical protein
MGRLAYQLLCTAVNESADDCTEECTSFGHREGCKTFDCAAMLIESQAKVASLKRIIMENVWVGKDFIGYIKDLERQVASLMKELETDAELFFQAGCFLSLMGEDVPAKRLLERAKKLVHPDADEQLAALIIEEEK